jgi:hypothetical protein
MPRAGRRPEASREDAIAPPTSAWRVGGGMPADAGRRRPLERHDGEELVRKQIGVLADQLGQPRVHVCHLTKPRRTFCCGRNV